MKCTKTEQIKENIIHIIKSEKLFYLIEIVICACNLAFIFDNAIWGDEGFSLILARKSIKEILVDTATDVHPPLYYLILKMIISFTGESIIISHLISYLAFIGVCIVIGTFIRKNFGLTSAYLALLLVGWTENGFIYNVEIRMYSIALLFITLTFCMAYKVIDDGRINNWILMSVFALLSSYTHYFALIAVAFIIWGTFIIGLIRRQEYIWKKIGITIILCVAGYLPWLTAMITTVERTLDDFWMTNVPTFMQCAEVFLGAMDYSRKLLIVLSVLIFSYVLKNVFEIVNGKIVIKRKIFFGGNCNSRIQMVVLGIFTFLGTTIVGILVSKYCRPILLVKYLYPMVVLGAISLGVLLNTFIDKSKIGQLFWLISIVIIVWMSKSGLDTYQNRINKFLERKYETENSLAELESFVEQEYIIVSNIDHFNWTVLEYYYPKSFKDYNEAINGKIEKAVILFENEMAEEQLHSLKKDDYVVYYENSGQIDDTEYHLYRLMRE